MIPCLLAPVPAAHIDSALETFHAQGRVAFGSGRAETDDGGATMWSFFKKLEDENEFGKLPVCIYVSQNSTHLAQESFAGHRVSFVGVLQDITGADNHGRHPKPYLRPATTLGTDGRWAMFWTVDSIKQLQADEWIPLGQFISERNGKPSAKISSVPRGPMRAFGPKELQALIG